jgi:hypothetical protein
MPIRMPWIAAGFFALSGFGPALAEDQAASVPVTPDNFARAETDMYFAVGIKQAGGLAKLFHHRDPMAIDNQTVVRGNRDTLYSSGIWDLDAGPVTVTMPEAGKRFMSVFAVSEDHYVTNVFYGAGKHTFTRKDVGTRYFMIGLRVLVDPADAADVSAVHALQDAVSVSQRGTGKFEVPNWDQASQKKVREALIALSATLPDLKRAFGSKKQVDPVRHLIGTASGWGGNPDKDAIYLNVTPPDNDGQTNYRLTAKDVPVDGFWSISVYDANGYYKANPLNSYSLNNITAKKSADGSIPVQFGGCDGKVTNCLPIMPGWNYMVRLYRPRDAVLSGGWTFPKAEPLR